MMYYIDAENEWIIKASKCTRWLCCEYTRRKGFILDDYKINADNVKFILSNASEFEEIVTYLPRNCRYIRFCYICISNVQCKPKIEKHITILYLWKPAMLRFIVMKQTIYPAWLRVGFFMPITVIYSILLEYA